MGNWGRWLWRNAGTEPPTGISGNLLRWIWRMAGASTPPVGSLVGSYGTIYGVGDTGAIVGPIAQASVQERPAVGLIYSIGNAEG